MHRRLTDVAAPSDLILTQAEIVSEPKYLSDCPHGHLFLGHESPPRPVEKLRSLVVQRLCSDEVFFRKSFRHVNNDSDAGRFFYSPFVGILYSHARNPYSEFIGTPYSHRPESAPDRLSRSGCSGSYSNPRGPGSAAVVRALSAAILRCTSSLDADEDEVSAGTGWLAGSGLDWVLR